jgi:maltooligosyltrehalose trehalohydrolase
VLDWYRDLIRLRRSVPDLTDPRLDRVQVSYDEDARWLVVRRGTCRVVVNLGGAERAVPLDRPPRDVLLSSGKTELLDDAARIPANSVSIVTVG